MPFSKPIPPSPDASEALLEAFADRGIEFAPGKRIASLDHDRNVAVCDDGSEEPFDLFLGVPKHRAPDVVQESGMAVDGYIPVDGRTLATAYPGVYAVGDVATVGVPKAGVVAESLLEQRRGGAPSAPYDGRGSCYIEFGEGRVGRVNVDFFSGPSPVGTLSEPSAELVAEKQEYGSSRRSRWFDTGETGFPP
jgi:sulfide:quinone oxidoreductase